MPTSSIAIAFTGDLWANGNDSLNFGSTLKPADGDGGGRTLLLGQEVGVGTDHDPRVAGGRAVEAVARGEDAGRRDQRAGAVVVDRDDVRRLREWQRRTAGDRAGRWRGKGGDEDRQGQDGCDRAKAAHGVAAKNRPSTRV